MRTADGSVLEASDGVARTAVLVFARAPRPGATKRRLIPALGEEGAARLHARMLRHAVHAALEADIGPVQLWVTPSRAHPVFRALAAELSIGVHLQRGEDVGRRMHHAFGRALRTHPAALVIGSDCPFLTPLDLRRAARCLAGDADAVLGPATDGGYVLIGLRRPCAALFEGVPWGSAGVLAATRQRLAAEGRKCRELEPRDDVDRPRDLAKLPPGWLD